MDLTAFQLDPSAPAPKYSLYAVSNHFGGLGGGNIIFTLKHFSLFLSIHCYINFYIYHSKGTILLSRRMLNQEGGTILMTPELLPLMRAMLLRQMPTCYFIRDMKMRVRWRQKSCNIDMVFDPNYQ